MALKDSFKNLTIALTKSFGALGQYKIVGTTSIDPITGAETVTETLLSTQYVKGVFNSHDKILSATLEAGDFFVITPVVGTDNTPFAPSLNDTFIIDGLEFAIFDFDKINAQGDDVTYKLFLRTQNT